MSSPARTVADSTPIRWWRDLMVPLPRATRFYVEAWLDWAASRRRGSDIPLARPSLSLGLQATLDETILTAFKVARPPQSPDAFRRIEQEVVDAIALYDERGWLADTELFHPAPPPLPEVELKSARLGRIGLSYEHLTFESGYEPFPDEPGRERWLGYEANRTAHAWVLRHEHDAPWLVCIHGAGMGRSIIDLTCFRAQWLHNELGLNLAFPVQPLHGPRGSDGPFSVGFPTDDLLDNVHGVAQSVWDTRRLISWIRRDTTQPVGLNGLSLGGYVTAMVAGLEDDLACVIAGVPAVDFASLFGAHAPTRAGDSIDFGTLMSLSRSVHHVISPMTLAPRPPRERRFIYAGLADRLVDPHDQARMLWEHWQRPRIAWFHGSHTGFYFSSEARYFVHEALVESGLARPEAAEAVATAS